MPPAPSASRDTRPNLYGMSRTEIEAFLVAQGGKRFHGDQVFRWLYARRHFDPAAYSDLSKGLRERITHAARVDVPTIASRVTARDGTVKFGVSLPGGGTVETVYMVQRDRVTLCVSSQVGCALNCDFCLTAKMGLVRHLTPGEIVGQVACAQEAVTLGDKPFNIVFMGMGEPLHNEEQVHVALDLLASPREFDLSPRHLLVSTVGISDAMLRLARRFPRVRLALSLHSAREEVRQKYELSIRRRNH